MKVADLFAGVGGLSQGFIKAGFEIAIAVEYDRDIAYSYQKNRPMTDVYAEDICQLDFKNLHAKHPVIDVVMGGPPCQGFSQKNRDLFKLSSDYDGTDKATQMFFAETQNKLLYAVTHQTGRAPSHDRPPISRMTLRSICAPINKRRQINFDEELLIIFFSILTYINEKYGKTLKYLSV